MFGKRSNFNAVEAVAVTPAAVPQPLRPVVVAEQPRPVPVPKEEKRPADPEKAKAF